MSLIGRHKQGGKIQYTISQDNTACKEYRRRVQFVALQRRHGRPQERVASSAPTLFDQKVHGTVMKKLGTTMGYAVQDIEDALSRDEPSAIKDAYLIVRENEMLRAKASMT